MRNNKSLLIAIFALVVSGSVHAAAFSSRARGFSTQQMRRMAPLALPLTTLAVYNRYCPVYLPKPTYPNIRVPQAFDWTYNPIVAKKSAAASREAIKKATDTMFNAVMVGDLEGVKKALANKADRHAIDAKGYTALSWAVDARNFETAEAALRTGTPYFVLINMVKAAGAPKVIVDFLQANSNKPRNELIEIVQQRKANLIEIVELLTKE